MHPEIYYSRLEVKDIYNDIEARESLEFSLKAFGNEIDTDEDICLAEIKGHILDNKISHRSILISADMISAQICHCIESFFVIEEPKDFLDIIATEDKRLPIWGRVAVLTDLVIEETYQEEFNDDILSEFIDYIQTTKGVNFIIIHPEECPIIKDSKNPMQSTMEYLHTEYDFISSEGSHPYMLLKTEIEELSPFENEELFGDDDDEEHEEEVFHSIMTDVISSMVSKVMTDNTISLKAKAIYNLLVIHDFELHVNDLVHIAKEGKGAIINGMKELFEKKYIDGDLKNSEYGFNPEMFLNELESIKEELEDDFQESEIYAELNQRNEIEPKYQIIFGDKEWYSSYCRPLIARSILMKKDMDINDRMKFGNTALIYASFHGDITMVKALYELNSDVFKHNEIGENAFTAAIIVDQSHIVRYFLNSGTTPLSNAEGISALAIAQSHSSTNCIKLLEK
ncbi:hypothetical protein AWM68_17580 [Fictibacillus phosphorivorans]|uniref:Uncharacterized protein n=1 Tax=Fictibacillus phosphorivorans TaxID=1221500 RepID=A0A165NWR8_9BACL|nr:ankyrin repeat domain-containing protein [Fictibacillus phosphorivorans]KZE67983.1 hypothetical protein AWM68_17580 [Fictibacillus phosphorivorans]